MTNYFSVTDNGIGDHHQHNNHHQYQPLVRHQAKVDSHKSVCVKPSSQLSSPSTPTSNIPSSNVCTSSSVTLSTSSTGLPTGTDALNNYTFPLVKPQKFIYSLVACFSRLLFFSSSAHFRERERERENGSCLFIVFAPNKNDFCFGCFFLVFFSLSFL